MLTDIDIKTISFKAWWEISKINGTWTNVAFKRWAETVYPEILENMSLDDWENISDILQYAPVWAAKKYQEYRKNNKKGD